jgi:transposase
MTCFNYFSDTREGPTVVVMDHASIHTSEAFQEEIPKWEQKGLSIFYLPKYSPEMKHLAASYEVSEGKGV